MAFGPSELAILVGIIILFFGAAKIPELARSLGRAKGEFQKGARESHKEMAQESTLEAQEEARVRKAAAEMGIPVEGRPLSDIKTDLRAKF